MRSKQTHTWPNFTAPGALRAMGGRLGRERARGNDPGRQWESARGKCHQSWDYAVNFEPRTDPLPKYRATQSGMRKILVAPNPGPWASRSADYHRTHAARAESCGAGGACPARSCMRSGKSGRGFASGFIQCFVDPCAFTYDRTGSTGVLAHYPILKNKVNYSVMGTLF